MNKVGEVWIAFSYQDIDSVWTSEDGAHAQASQLKGGRVQAYDILHAGDAAGIGAE